jgi:hypothetical protein
MNLTWNKKYCFIYKQSKTNTLFPQLQKIKILRRNISTDQNLCKIQGVIQA